MEERKKKDVQTVKPKKMFYRRFLAKRGTNRQEDLKDKKWPKGQQSKAWKIERHTNSEAYREFLVK